MSKTFTVSLIDVLFLHDSIATNQHLITVFDTISFTDSFETFPQNINIQDVLYFHENVKIVSKNKKLTVSDRINFHDNVSYVLIPSVIHGINQNLVFTQTLTVSAAKACSNVLNFVDNVTVNINKHITISDTLIFTQYANAYKIPKPKLPGYLPPGSTVPEKPNATVDIILTDPITITPRTEVTFTQADGNSFGLFRPSFGNQYKTQYNHIQSETMGRGLILAGNHTYQYRKSIKYLKMKFEYLKEQEADSFLAFLNNNLGLPIVIQDHEGITYNGFISTPELEITQVDRVNRSLEFEFEIIP